MWWVSKYSWLTPRKSSLGTENSYLSRCSSICPLNGRPLDYSCSTPSGSSPLSVSACLRGEKRKRVSQLPSQESWLGSWEDRHYQKTTRYKFPKEQVEILKAKEEDSRNKSRAYTTPSNTGGNGESNPPTLRKKYIYTAGSILHCLKQILAHRLVDGYPAAGSSR